MENSSFEEYVHVLFLISNYTEGIKRVTKVANII